MTLYELLCETDKKKLLKILEALKSNKDQRELYEKNMLANNGSSALGENEIINR